MKIRTLMGIALFCAATSSVRADEFAGQFFLEQSVSNRTPAADHGAAKPAAANPASAPAISGRPATRTKASWYGGGERLARRTASGEVFHPDALTAAHRTLPLGTRLVVSANGRSVVVRVNDRGPAAWTGRSLDLSRGAARALGMVGAGTAVVSYRVASL